jgi:cytochrome P450
VEVLGAPAWAVTTHAALKAVHDDENQYGKDPNLWAWAPQVPQGWPLMSWVQREMRNMLLTDPPDHTRLRALVSKAFTPRQIDRLRPLIVDYATAYCADLSSHGPVVDLRESYALKLPLTVICHLFGVPANLQGRLERQCAVVFNQTATPQEALTAHMGLQETLQDVIDAKRSRAGGDLTSALIAARDARDRLDDNELLWQLVLLLGAGFETTVNAICNAVVGLLSHPAQLDLVTGAWPNDGRVPWEHVVTETLRWRPPIAALPFRYARGTTTLAGQRLEAGDALLMCYSAAALDTSHHGPNADQFNIARIRSAPHLAFGHGPHYCLGAALARLETEIALRVLFEAYPDLALSVPAQELRPLPSLVADGPAALPVHLTSSEAMR